MAICDSRKRFTYCFVGYPGSAHDQRVFGNSSLGIVLYAHPEKYFPSNYYHIVGDSAFQLHQHVMVPYKDTGLLKVTEINYNTKLSQTRHLIENAFGSLKGRLRRLRRLECKLSRVSSMIIACCVLHNLTISDDLEMSLLMSDMPDCPADDTVSYDSSAFSAALPVSTNAAKQK